MQRNNSSPRTKGMGGEKSYISTAFVHTPVPAYLCEQICQAVQRERMRRERLRFIFSSLCGTSSLVGLVFVLPALGSAASSSGFISYFKLLLTDSDLVTGHLSIFFVPMLEALPAVQVIAALFLIAVLLVSAKNLICSIKYTSFTFNHPTLTHA